jgi:hypothetical protein
VGHACSAVEGYKKGVLISKSHDFTVAATFYFDERSQRYRRQLGFEHGSDSTDHAPRHML